jgi:hypothetical protein
LATQLTAELTVVRDYISKKEPLINGTETATPRHLDLKDAARVKTSFDQKLVDARKLEYRTNRREWVEQIVWRAVVVHPNLWTGAPPSVLQTEERFDAMRTRLRPHEGTCLGLLLNSWAVGSNCSCSWLWHRKSNRHLHRLSWS